MESVAGAFDDGGVLGFNRGGDDPATGGEVFGECPQHALLAFALSRKEPGGDFCRSAALRLLGQVAGQGIEEGLGSDGFGHHGQESASEAIRPGLGGDLRSHGDQRKRWLQPMGLTGQREAVGVGELEIEQRQIPGAFGQFFQCRSTIAHQRKAGPGFFEQGSQHFAIRGGIFDAKQVTALEVGSVGGMVLGGFRAGDGAG